MADDPLPAEAPASWRTPLILVSLLGALVSYFTFADFLFEDSYITLRYATQLAEGQGLVFQPGEKVLGTSTPLWALLLAVPLALGASPELVLDLAFCASLAALAYAGGRLLQRLGSPAAGVVFAAAISLGVARLQAYWGMETPLYTALLLGAWCLALDKRYAGSGLLLGLACVARYEGYAFGLAMAIGLASLGRWSAVRRGGLAFSAITLPWLAVAWSYYGNPLPLPAGAKAGHVSPLRYFERSYLDLPHDLFWPSEGWGYEYPIGLALSVLVGIFGLLGLGRLIQTRATIVGTLPLGGLLVFAVLVAFGPGPLCTWHRAPLHVIGLLMALLGASALLGRFASPAARRRLALAATALILLASIPVHLSASARMRNTFQYVGREIAYPEVADFLRQTRLNEATVLTWEPGYLAFMSDIRVIDVAGLVTPAPSFTAGEVSRWDHGFPPEADLVLLRAPFRPGGFELIFEGSMGSWLFARPPVAERYAEAIRTYRSGDFRGADIPRLSAGPVALTPSYSGPPFEPDPLGSGTRIGPDQEMLAITAETPILWLDSASAEIEFQTSTPEIVQLQLVVRGEVVLSSSQDPGTGDGTVTWDLRPWLGRSARLRVLILAGSSASASFGLVSPKG